MMRKLLVLLSLLYWGTAVQAFELVTQKVTGDVYALIGEIGPRSYDNHAMNNTMGFIVTAEGVVLVGPGASPSGAKVIEKAVARVTDKPIRWVVNVGAQDHHWLGNSYFASRGAEVIALVRTVSSQQIHVDDHLRRLRQVVKERADGVMPLYAPNPLEGDRAKLNLGGKNVQLIWPGNGHFSGDAILWLPTEKVVFTGDFVFNDRMLGVQPNSPVTEWQQAFKKIAALQPLQVIPGHGYPGNLEKAQLSTGDYLDFLVNGVSHALEEWQDLAETTDRMGDAPEFRYLQFYDGWHRRNINRTYLQLEAVQE